MDVVVDFAELPDPVVTESPAHAAEELAVADPLGDRDQHEQLPAEDRVGQFRPYFVVLAVERDQPGDPRRILDHGGKRWLPPFCLGGRGRRRRGCGGGCRGVDLDGVGGRNRGRLLGAGRGDIGGADRESSHRRSSGKTKAKGAEATAEAGEHASDSLKWSGRSVPKEQRVVSAASETAGTSGHWLDESADGKRRACGERIDPWPALAD